MIFGRYIKAESSKVFLISQKVIWLSALFMGILASIPKILQLRVSLTEVIVDCIIAFFYSLFVWFYNLYTLPRYANHAITTRFFGARLIRSLLLGIVVMGILVIVNQLLFKDRLIGTMMLMYQFRGILINLTIYMFLYLLYQSFINRIIAIELERTKSDHIEAQYELLKQQVNPHFLFNSLNTLKSMVEIGDEHSADFIVKLSDFYRYSLESRKKDVVPMQEELKLLEAYFYLLQARFEEGITLQLDISPEHKKTMIPVFTLQLLVENAVKHNIVSIDQPLKIELISSDNNLIIKNNLQLKSIPEPSTKIGLENINQRYLHLTGRQIEVRADGYFFTVKLPINEHISH
ncbi:sensor histidine kinase [Mucilaginibacter sp. KACC 22063]|uniref:sensor histidine kinase n=1 Tax=Mucilaginibacter sp. KACC 22063 TaxID=3025666 RepID=UPI0023665790|nr:histidine kinase [Mucilaginibacter sp. KACC 22063]WDF57265.1 histidine kinase [Mucilaginibacter sp. KACC 22063]